mmetsp:Transcript_306/g.565  ORF Transcript_306/g.565 Transcript_306/m.565 type:complete len:229 (-) Transcript_306:816-1502(-)
MNLPGCLHLAGHWEVVHPRLLVILQELISPELLPQSAMPCQSPSVEPPRPSDCCVVVFVGRYLEDWFLREERNSGRSCLVKGSLVQNLGLDLSFPRADVLRFSWVMGHMPVKLHLACLRIPPVRIKLPEPASPVAQQTPRKHVTYRGLGQRVETSQSNVDHWLRPESSHLYWKRTVDVKRIVGVAWQSNKACRFPGFRYRAVAECRVPPDLLDKTHHARHFHLGSSLT